VHDKAGVCFDTGEHELADVQRLNLRDFHWIIQAIGFDGGF
jgi:hypothetical protein